MFIGGSFVVFVGCRKLNSTTKALSSHSFFGEGIAISKNAIVNYAHPD
jgi:hypothetical protein